MKINVEVKASEVIEVDGHIALFAYKGARDTKPKERLYDFRTAVQKKNREGETYFANVLDVVDGEVKSLRPERVVHLPTGGGVSVEDGIELFRKAIAGGK